MDNINSHINVDFFQKTTGRSRERSASILYIKKYTGHVRYTVL